MAPTKDHERGISLELEVETKGDEVPLEYAVVPLLQDIFLRVLGILKRLAHSGSVTGIFGDF